MDSFVVTALTCSSLIHSLFTGCANCMRCDDPKYVGWSKHLLVVGKRPLLLGGVWPSVRRPIAAEL